MMSGLNSKKKKLDDDDDDDVDGLGYWHMNALAQF